MDMENSYGHFLPRSMTTEIMTDGDDDDDINCAAFCCRIHTFPVSYTSGKTLPLFMSTWGREGRWGFRVMGGWAWVTHM